MTTVDNLYTWDLPLMTQANSPMINYRKDAKRAVKFTFMVVGELGTGKTTFINCLLNKKVLLHRYGKDDNSVDSDTKTLAFTSVKLVALPNTSILTKNDFNPDTANEEPGIALTETKIEMIDDLNQRLLLSVIDAPGFGENLNNEICFLELENYLKQQFDLVLAEETRIRRNPRFTDTRVHVMLYFITPTGHGLRELDISCMKRLSKYVNIIPVIGRADSFTEKELKQFKNQIRVDIEKFNVPIFQFDNYLDEYNEEEDYELIEECKFLAKLQPFAVVASEDTFDIRDHLTGEVKTIRGRQYPWGIIDINNPKYSDFPILKLVILGLHLQDLKDLTHDFLYEQYRTERLTSVTGGAGIGENDYENGIDQFSNKSITTNGGASVNGGPNGLNNAAVPSLSNLAQLTKQETITSQILDSETILGSTHKAGKKLMLLDEDDDELATNGDGGYENGRSSYDAHSQSSNHLHEELIPLPKLNDESFGTVPGLNFDDHSSQSNNNRITSTNSAFKRMSIGPQRNQLRQISETVPYVLKHERIVERQHKLEELEMASAKELATRAALLEQKAQELKAKEKLLLKKLEEKQRANQKIDNTTTTTGGNSEAEAILAATLAHTTTTSENNNTQVSTHGDDDLVQHYPVHDNSKNNNDTTTTTNFTNNNIYNHRAYNDSSDYENAQEEQYADNLDDVEPEKALLDNSNYRIKKDETLTDLHTVVSGK